MRFSCLVTCLFVFSHAMTFAGEKIAYPYDAEVDQADGADVWSGPDSKKHYKTTRLNKGDRVKVIRSDPGGWCMIEPPKGSHCWVRADSVDKDGEDRGAINSNRVKVHVGSGVNPDNIQTYQAELSKGDAVEIFGERVFNLDDVPRRMLKINPVAKREWRWISRKSIVPVDAVKPFPSEQSALKTTSDSINEGDWDVVSHPGSMTPPATPILDERKEATAENREVKQSERNPSQQPGKLRLTEIDREFRDMIKSDRDVWNLDSIENQYVQLDEEIGTAWMSAQITARLEAVKRYRKIYDQYAEFMKLTSDAKQRDAELMALQSRYQSQATARIPTEATTESPNVTQSSPATTPALLPMATASTASQSASATTASQSGASPATSLPGTIPAAPPQGTTPPASPQGAALTFDGAGIVKKLSQSFPGGPQYVLITPEGKALTFLQPTPGIDLNRYDGRAMGITGQRVRRDDWSSDVIMVRNLQPVQLRNTRQ